MAFYVHFLSSCTASFTNPNITQNVLLRPAREEVEEEGEVEKTNSRNFFQFTEFVFLFVLFIKNDE